MSINRDELYELHKISKDKKDGVWSKNGKPYIVLSGNLEFIGNHSVIYAVHGHFVTEVWSGESYKMKKKMKDIYNDRHA